jgi:hypothetical protein
MSVEAVGWVFMVIGCVLLLSGVAGYRIVRQENSLLPALLTAALLSGPGAIVLLAGLFFVSFEGS